MNIDIEDNSAAQELIYWLKLKENMPQQYHIKVKNYDLYANDIIFIDEKSTLYFEKINLRSGHTSFDSALELAEYYRKKCTFCAWDKPIDNKRQRFIRSLKDFELEIVKIYTINIHEKIAGPY